MSNKSHRKMALAAAAVTGVAAVLGSSQSAMAQTATPPTFGISIGVREGTTSTTVGAASGTPQNAIEWINAAGVQVSADGMYHTITFNLGNEIDDDPTTYFAGTAATGQTNNRLDGLFVGLEHLRIVNTQGSTRPVSLWIDDIVTTSASGVATTLTDFSSVPTTIANNTSNVLFREPSISGSTTPNFARNFVNSSTTQVQPDGTTDATKQAARINFRFNTPEVVTASTGWGRAIASSTNAAIPANPVINGVGSTLTMRVALVANEPLYGFVGYETGNFDWVDDTGANWGKGPNAATINAPNGSSATALFDEPLPEAGAPTPRTVFLNAPISIQNLHFTTQVPYTIVGDETLTITRSAIDIVPTINVEAGDHRIETPVTFTSGSAAAVQATYAPLVWVSTGASVTLTQIPTVVRQVLATGGTPTNSLTKRGGGKLTIRDVDVDTLTVIQGTLEMAPLASSTLATLAIGSSTIPNAGGRVQINPTGGAVKSITTISVVAGSVGTLGSAPTEGGDLAVGTMNIGANAKLSLDLAGKSSLKLGTLGLNVTNPGGVLTAQLNVGDDGVLLDYTAAGTDTTIRNSIISGYNAGAWGGKGITSDLLPADGRYGIGYKSFVTGDVFMGRTVADDTSIGFRYTLKGDTNIDGTVDFDDLLALSQNYDPTFDPTGAGGPKLWSTGDSDYNGIVNFDDLLALSQNYNQSALNGEQLSLLGSSFAADWALAQSLVPEPTTLGLLGGLAVMGLRRRR